MAEPGSMLENSLIVAAHPDDEMLWFGAVLPKVDEVIIVFEDFWPDPAMGPARADALSNFPRENVSSLKLAEAASYGCADWANPQISPWGIELTKTCEIRDAKQKAKRLVGKSNAPVEGIRAVYKSNFETLVDQLRPKLNPQMNVFTHNPWGEYGHEDHVLVFRALDLLCEEIGFTLWMSNYCTERTVTLAKTYFDNETRLMIELPVDKVFCDKVADVYRQAGCWTWSDEWTWFDTEFYMEAPRKQVFSKTQAHLIPLNFFNIDPN